MNRKLLFLPLAAVLLWRVEKGLEDSIEDISGWRPMTYSEALLMRNARTTLGIDNSRYYLFDNEGTVQQMLMSNATVSTPSSNAAYVRPVATVTISQE